MSSTPQYSFQLITNKFLVAGFSNAWGNMGFVGPSWVPWVYNGVTNSWTATTGAAVGQTDVLRSPFVGIPKTGAIEIFLQVKTQYDEYVEVALSQAGGADFEILSQGMTTVFCPGGTTRTKILKQRHEMYANANDYISIRTKSKTVAGPINIEVSLIAVVHIGGNTRVIEPGNFKQLNYELERSPNYWGAVPSLAGNIQLVGEDYRWLRDILFQHPSQTVVLKLIMSVNNFTKEFHPVILDTTSLLGIGEDGKSFQANVPLLRDSEWTRLLANIDQRFDINTPYDVDSFPTIDGAPVDGNPALPNGVKKIKLERKFFGRAAALTVSVPADGIYYIGFGNTIVINDNFEFATGIGTRETISTGKGVLNELSGNVQFTFNSNGMAVEAITNNAGTWGSLTSGLSTAIVITNFNGPYWAVRVRNNTGAARNMVISGVTSSNQLNLTMKVAYTYTPVGYRPLLALKHYLARILGEYDNIDAPVFSNNFNGTGSFGAGVPPHPPLNNPPPLNFSDYSGDPLVAIYSLTAGNYYTGGINWIRLGNGNAAIQNQSFTSNSLMVRSIISYHTTYFGPTLGGALKRCSINIISFSNVQSLDIYGHRLMRKELLATIPLVIGFQNIDFSIPRFYDGIGIIATPVPATLMSIEINAISILPPNPNPFAGGEYAKTLVCSGLNYDEIQINNVYAFENLFRLTCTMQDILKSLTTIFGLGMRPLVDVTTGYIKVVIEKVTDLFLPAVSTVTFECQSFEYTPDPELVYDGVTIGGMHSEDQRYYLDASSMQSVYKNKYLTTKAAKDMTFSACLNTPLITQQETNADNIIILDIHTFTNDGGPTNIFYRLDEDLTIVGSPSPLQPNWLYSEGRLMRKNSAVIFAGGSELYNLMFGKGSNFVSVNYSGDSLGAISDSFPIFGTGVFKPFLIRTTTDFDLEDINTLEADIHKKFNAIVGTVTVPVYVKKVSYNFASGKLLLDAWLTDNTVI